MRISFYKNKKETDLIMSNAPYNQTWLWQNLKSL